MPDGTRARTASSELMVTPVESWNHQAKKNIVQKENSRPTWAQHPHNLLALMVGELAVLKVDHPGQNTVRKWQTGKQT